MRERIKFYFGGLAAVGFMLLFIFMPEVSKNGALKGVLLSGRVIIPSLFPFTACVLYIMKSDIIGNIKFLSPVTKKVFHLTPQLFIIFLLSMLGGYPVGARLLNEAVENGTVTEKNAGLLLNCSVNAGPAFVILTVGGIAGSKTIGLILFLSHIIPSFILAAFFGLFTENERTVKKEKNKNLSVPDCFVESVSSAAASVLSVCGYVILFSSVTAVFMRIEGLKYVTPLLEVTNAVTVCDNIYFVSFLLGFSGLSIWCQVFGASKNIKVNLISFVLSRLVHGGLSALFTAAFFKIFKITVNTLSIKKEYTYGGIPLSLSLMSLVILLIIVIGNKKSTGNLLRDIV